MKERKANLQAGQQSQQLQSTGSSLAMQRIAVSDLLVWAAQKARAEKQSADTRYNRISKHLEKQPLIVLESDAIRRCFDGDSYNSTLKSEVIRMPRVDSQEFVAMLSFKYNWARSLPELRLRLGLYSEDPAGGLQAIGFRLESPEPGGRHEFPHIQPIRQYSKNGPALPCPSWFPQKEPTMPLCGRKPVDLAIALLLALYGTGVLVEISNLQNKTLTPWINEYAQYLQPFRSRAFLYEDERKNTTVVTTWYDETDRQRHAKKKRLKNPKQLSAGDVKMHVAAGSRAEVW